MPLASEILRTASCASATPLGGAPAGLITKWIVPHAGQRNGLPSGWVLKNLKDPSRGAVTGVGAEVATSAGAPTPVTWRIAPAPSRASTVAAAKKVASADGRPP